MPYLPCLIACELVQLARLLDVGEIDAGLGAADDEEVGIHEPRILLGDGDRAECDISGGNCTGSREQGTMASTNEERTTYTVTMIRFPEEHDAMSISSKVCPLSGILYDVV